MTETDIIKLDYKNALESTIGHFGIQDANLYTDTFKETANKVQNDLKNKKITFREYLIDNEQWIHELKTYATEIKGTFNTLVIIGTGGSALGFAAIHEALNHYFHNERTKISQLPKVYIVDNIDPLTTNEFWEHIDIERTHCITISKSGETVDTLEQLSHCIQKMEEVNSQEEVSKQITCITDNKDSRLYDLVTNNGYTCFFIPQDLTGRYSVFSAVGILPALLVGIDCDELIQGALALDQQMDAEFKEHPAFLYTAIQLLAYENGQTMQVLMPYGDKLHGLALWFRQLWAESLSKRENKDGDLIRFGQTPIIATGSRDQHSQLQLYTEGPYDKIITFLTVGTNSAPIYKEETRTETNSFSNKLLKEAKNVTEEILTTEQKANITLSIDEITPYTLGALFYFFMISTVFAGHYLNIDIFNQPSVETTKKESLLRQKKNI